MRSSELSRKSHAKAVSLSDAATRQRDVIASQQPACRTRITGSELAAGIIRTSQTAPRVDRLLDLQRTNGNRFVLRLMHGNELRAQTKIVEHAPAPRLSLYAAKSISSKQYRVSDDESIAVRQDTNIVGQRTFYGSKFLYAEPSLITSSGTLLHTQGSALVLSQGSNPPLTVRSAKRAVSISSARFTGDGRLEAIMRGQRNRYIRLGSRGVTVTKIQQALLDAGYPLPKHGVSGKVNAETVAAIKSFQSAKGLVGDAVDGVIGSATMGILDKHFGGGPKSAVAAKSLRPAKPKNIITKTEGTSMEIVDDCGGCAKTIMMGNKPGFTTGSAHGKSVKGVYLDKGVEKETPVFVTSEDVRDYVLMKVTGKPNATSAKMAYWAKSAAERDLLDKQFGINQYANVQTGESHSIVQGDAVGWNWHWGAVVMRSGNDLVTLENFAGSGSNAWDFQMYSATGAKSFHAEQKGRLQADLVTPEYGYKPITVRIKGA